MARFLVSVVAEVRKVRLRLYRFTHHWVDTLWPLATLLRRIPVIGYGLNWRLLVPDYSAEGLAPDMLKDWAYLNCFDALSPRFDKSQTRRRVAAWCKEAGLVNVTLRCAGTIEIRATAAAAPLAGS